MVVTAPIGNVAKHYK